MRQSALRTAARILRLHEATLSAVMLVVLGVGALIAVWVLRPPAHRSGFIEEATLAAAVLGFLVSVITLLGAAQESRAAHAPPDFSVEWQAQGESDCAWVPLQLTRKDETNATIVPSANAL